MLACIKKVGLFGLALSVLAIPLTAQAQPAEAPTQPSEAPAAADAATEGAPAAPSTYLESIETPSSGTVDVINESDGLAAEAEAVEAGDPPAFVSKERENKIEEIVVSARKRQELLEDTPVSVTALSETTLREAGVTRIDDIAELVPNLTFQTSSTGTEALVYIRGVGTPRALTSYDPGVGIYIDGIFVPRAQGSLLNVVDIAQVEVLRGPQGTLFGKNTIGGAINFTTQKPTDEVEAFVQVDVGNVDAPHSQWLNSVTTRAMLNLHVDIGPLEDRVFMRMAFGSENQAGYMYNEELDQGWNDRNSLSFLGSLRILPHEDVTIDITGNWDRSHARGEGGECVFVQPTGLQGLAPGLADYCQEERKPYHFGANWNQLFDIQSTGAWGVLNWDIGPLPGLDEFSLKAIGAWRQQYIRSRQDTDLTPAPAVNAAGIGDIPIPAPEGTDSLLAMQGRPAKAQQFQTELQVNGSALDGRLNFVGGYFLFLENAQNRGATAALVDTINTRSVQPQLTDNWSWALYSQASFDLLEWLQLTAGLRYTEDKKETTAEKYDCVPSAEGCASFRESFNETNSKIFSTWNPMATLSATVPEDLIEDTVIDHLMGYFTYSSGFKGGGFNVIPPPADPLSGDQQPLQPFDPENMNSFELGFKTLSFDNRIATNLSLFYAKYDDIQVTAIRDLGYVDANGTPVIAQETLNAAKATTQGVELETVMNLGAGFRLEGSVGLFRGVYDNWDDAPSDVTTDFIDRSGETFRRVPEVQTHVALQKSFLIEANDSEFWGGYMTPRFDWYFQGPVRFQGPEYEAGLQGGYSLFNARLAYSFNGEATQLALWSQNLGNKRYRTNSIPLVTTFGIAQQLYGLPRTYGLELSHRF